MLEKHLQGFPGATAEIGKKLPVRQEVTVEDCRNAEDKIPMRTLLEDIHAQPLPEYSHALLMAGWAEMTPLARECQEVFMAALFASHAGTPVVQIAAIEIARDHLLDIGPPEAYCLEKCSS